MPGTTPIFGFPYPEPTDPTNVPGDIQSLAVNVETDLNAHLVDTTAAHAASAISFTPVGQLGSTTVQGALAELADEEKGITSHVFTASGSLAAATVSGAKKLRIRVQAPGGGSGGCATNAAGATSAGGPGGGGGYAEAVVTMTGLVFPLAVTVGAVGAAGAAGANNGGVGGSCSVVSNNGAGTTLCAATGGGGGTGGPTGTVVPQAMYTNGFGGAGTVGDILVAGSDGGQQTRYSVGGPPIAGEGGASVLGGATVGGLSGAGNAGVAGKAYGGGAAGSRLGPSQTQLAGAAGGPGIVIIDAIY